MDTIINQVQISLQNASVWDDNTKEQSVLQQPSWAVQTQQAEDNYDTLEEPAELIIDISDNNEDQS
jgi:hypothetical protein